MEYKFELGEKVKIVSDSTSHGFKKGTTVTIISRRKVLYISNTYRKHYLIKKNLGVFWALEEDLTKKTNLIKKIWQKLKQKRKGDGTGIF